MKPDTKSSQPPHPQKISARCGTATLLQRNQTLKIINTSGHQVIDFFAFALHTSTPSASSLSAPVFPSATPSSLTSYSAASNTAAMAPEYLSMSHTRTSLLKLTPEVGDVLRSQKRAPMLTFTEDTSPGWHDTLIPPCDRWRYAELGVEGYHKSCTDNVWDALDALGKTLERKQAEGAEGVSEDVVQSVRGLQAGLGGRVPDSWNLFMNVPVAEGDAKSKIRFDAPECEKGDYVRLRAERDLVVVMSSCPQDVTNINGGEPKDADFIVEG